MSLQKAFHFMFQTDSVWAPIRSPGRKQTCSLPLFQYGKLIFCVSISMNKCVPQGKTAGLHAWLVTVFGNHVLALNLLRAMNRRRSRSARHRKAILKIRIPFI